MFTPLMKVFRTDQTALAKCGALCRRRLQGLSTLDKSCYRAPNKKLTPAEYRKLFLLEVLPVRRLGSRVR
jgi:hypothetical protein